MLEILAVILSAIALVSAGALWGIDLALRSLARTAAVCDVFKHRGRTYRVEDITETYPSSDKATRDGRVLFSNRFGRSSNSRTPPDRENAP